ncbi:Uncharacterised protein [Capnocytophaga ochracea]|uniref:Uncharacterized protein n=1 Tax=Capnocytophaga ochracea TaxID=1018 RepID=A0A2X2RF76_CAPOC|nr:hypothetical protein HMPREF1528_00777 [Capnocytophaga sp. oral taxon 336 str. F0502]SQA79082.1 Uncharacterised protein [Capnocytophaga ochracea]
MVKLGDLYEPYRKDEQKTNNERYEPQEKIKNERR